MSLNASLDKFKRCLFTRFASYFTQYNVLIFVIFVCLNFLFIMVGPKILGTVGQQKTNIRFVWHNSTEREFTHGLTTRIYSAEKDTPLRCRLAPGM
jgi:hypothetical protein